MSVYIFWFCSFLLLFFSSLRHFFMLDTITAYTQCVWGFMCAALRYCRWCRGDGVVVVVASYDILTNIWSFIFPPFVFLCSVIVVCLIYFFYQIPNWVIQFMVLGMSEHAQFRVDRLNICWWLSFRGDNLIYVYCTFHFKLKFMNIMLLPICFVLFCVSFSVQVQNVCNSHWIILNEWNKREEEIQTKRKRRRRKCSVFSV